MTDPRLVRVEAGRLVADGAPLRAVGTNCYFLQEEGARAALGWTGFDRRVDEAVHKGAGLGLTVLRAWAFHDDPGNPATLQRAPGDRLVTGFDGIDRALELAPRLGLRLILSLGNHWPDYGGIAQYLRWHGRPEGDTEAFFTDPAIRDHYASHLAALLDHVNPRTGRRWGDDPAVLGWELMNEPRGPSVAGWATDLVARLRPRARQLWLTGGEGFDPRSGFDPDARDRAAWEAETGAVDVASIHLYPEEWGWPADTHEEAGLRWILDHADRAAALGKPLVLGEFGLSNAGVHSLSERRRIYARWMDVALRHPAVAAVLSWSFSTDDRPDAWDGFTWGWRDGTAPEDPANRYADLHRDAAARWTSGALA